MVPDWNEDQPIYRQLRDKVAGAILDGSLREGEAIPSVRSVAVDMRINPLTASRAYQELVNEELVETRRGLGMFVLEGARARLLDSEKKRFLDREWPQIVSRIMALDLDVEGLLQSAKSIESRSKS